MPGLAGILLAACLALADGAGTGVPVVSIIIDDLGWRLRDGLSAIALPGPMAYAVLPHSPHAERLAEAAFARHKEVLLHLPMEAQHDNDLLGPDALDMSMNRAQLARTFRRALAAVPHAVGVSNHMGSKMTAALINMRWLMSSLRRTGGLFFIDNRTTPDSVADVAAHDANLPYAVRDVFLDNVRATSDIERQLRRLVERAHKRGSAVGVAHPHEETMATLRRWDPAAQGVRLVSVSELIRRQRSSRPETSAAGPSASPTPECGDDRGEPQTTEDPHPER